MTTPALRVHPQDMTAPELARLVIPKEIRQLGSRITRVTPGLIDSALSNREQGYLEKWVDLCGQMQTDPTLSFAYETRKRAVAGRPIDVDEPEEVATEMRGLANEAASLVREWLTGIDDLEAVLMRIMDALMTGLHVSELLWERRHGVWLPTPAQVYTRECEFDYDSTVRCRGADYRWVRTADHPGKFLVHIPWTSSGPPTDQGIGGKAVWYWFMRGSSWKFWMIAAERFGNPLAIARLGTASGGTTREAMARQLDSLMTTSTAVVTGDDSIDILDAKAAGSSAVWSELVTKLTQELCFAMGVSPDLLMVGANGGRSSTDSRDGVRLESSKLDAKMLMGTLTRAARWVVWYNLRRADAPMPVLRTVFEDARPVDAIAMSTGRVRVNQVLAGVGLPALSDEDGGNAFVPAPQTAAAQQGVPASFTAPTAATATTAPGSAPAASPFPTSGTPAGMPSLSAMTPTSPTSSRSRMSRAVFARAQR